MDSHESAGIPEEEYVRLRRRTMLERGMFAGGIWMMLALKDGYKNYCESKAYGFELFAFLVLGPLFGWLVGYCSWGLKKDKALTEYKKQREIAPQRKPLDKWEARSDLVLCAAGMVIMGLDLWLTSRTLKDYAAPAVISGVIMASVAGFRMKRREAYYRKKTNAPGAPPSKELDPADMAWFWVMLMLGVPFGAIPVLSLILFFSILFYPLDRALTLRSQREFGGGETNKMTDNSEGCHGES